MHCNNYEKELRRKAWQGNGYDKYNLALYLYRKHIKDELWDGHSWHGLDEGIVELFMEAAEQGYGDAQYSLARCYQKGWGVQKSRIEAVRWYRRAAEQGHIIAQDELGTCFKYGFGVPKDYDEAARLFKKAAEQGYAAAQKHLGDCYHFGHGVPEDDDKALEWYEKAVRQGYKFAQLPYKLLLHIRDGELDPMPFVP